MDDAINCGDRFGRRLHLRNHTPDAGGRLFAIWQSKPRFLHDVSAARLEGRYGQHVVTGKGKVTTAGRNGLEDLHITGVGSSRIPIDLNKAPGGVDATIR